MTWLASAASLPEAAKLELLERVLRLLDDCVIIKSSTGEALFSNQPEAAAAAADDDLSITTIKPLMADGGLLASILHGSTLQVEISAPIAQASGNISRVLHELPHMLSIATPPGGLQFVNQTVATYTGKSIDFLLGRDACLPLAEQTIRSLVHPDDLPRLGSIYATYAAEAAAGAHKVASAGGIPTPGTGHAAAVSGPPTAECRLRAADGSYRWCRSSVTRLHCAERDPGHVELVFHAVDIQEQKELQARLEDERALLTCVMEQLPVGACLCKPTGEVRLINSRLLEMLGIGSAPALPLAQYGQWVGYHPDGRRYEVMDWPMARCLIRGEVIPKEDHIIGRPDGSRPTLRICAAPVYSSAGALLGGVLVTRDVTEELQRAEDRARFEASQRTANGMRALMVRGTRAAALS
jgi:PAS domain-containing protein